MHRERGEGRKTQDGYEAIWERVFGKPISYPPPRYKTPIVMRPENFPWHERQGAPGIRRKLLGTFPERDLGLEILSMEAPFTLEAGPARCLLFAYRGKGWVGGGDYEPPHRYQA